MKSRCTKEELLHHIRAQIRRKYKSQVEAAEDMGQSPQYLNLALSGRQKELPVWLIERFGYKKVIVYEKIKY
jgi:hypothetical protein